MKKSGPQYESRGLHSGQADDTTSQMQHERGMHSLDVLASAHAANEPMLASSEHTQRDGYLDYEISILISGSTSRYRYLASAARSYRYTGRSESGIMIRYVYDCTNEYACCCVSVRPRLPDS